MEIIWKEARRKSRGRFHCRGVLPHHKLLITWDIWSEELIRGKKITSNGSFPIAVDMLEAVLLIRSLEVVLSRDRKEGYGAGCSTSRKEHGLSNASRKGHDSSHARKDDRTVVFRGVPHPLLG